MSRGRGVPAVVAVAADTVGTRELVALLNTSTVYDRSQLLADREPHALHTCDVTVDESAVAAGPRITIDAAWRTVPNAAEVRIVIACAPGGHFQRFQKTTCSCSMGSHGRCRHVGATLFLFTKDPAACMHRRIVAPAPVVPVVAAAPSAVVVLDSNSVDAAAHSSNEPGTGAPLPPPVSAGPPTKRVLPAWMAGTGTAPPKGRKSVAAKATAPAEPAAAAKPVSRRERLGKTRAMLSDDEDDNDGTETHFARTRQPPAPPRRGRVVSDDDQDAGEDSAVPSRTAKRPRPTTDAATNNSASNGKTGGNTTSNGVAVASKGSAAARSGRARSTAELLDLLMESDHELSLEAAPVVEPVSAATVAPAPAKASAVAPTPELATVERGATTEKGAKGARTEKGPTMEKGPTRVSAIAAAAALGAIMGTPLDLRLPAATSTLAAEVGVRPWEAPAPFEAKPPLRPVSAREMMSRLLGGGGDDDAL